MNDHQSLIGLQIDHFMIIKNLGAGGMSSVYLASDLSLKRDIALKVLLPTLSDNEELRLRFHREAQATAQLHHPNIVQVYTTGTMPDNSPYIALQYIEGGSLSDHLQQLAAQGQWISTIYGLSIARQMADALQAAHKANIIHRDLKPSNILLHNDGTPVLSDLGIAAVQQATLRLTQTGGIVGTPNYMSPEQASGQVIDGRSDIYSLGVILYELLSGQLPFEADSPWAMLHQHIYDQPAPLAQIRPDLTPQTTRLVQTCLQKKPEDRFPNAQALASALDGALAAENANPLITRGALPVTIVETAPGPVAIPTVESAPVHQSPTSASGKRAKWPYVLLAGVFLLVIMAILLYWQRNQTPTAVTDAPPTPEPAELIVPPPTIEIQPSAISESAGTVEEQPVEEVIPTAIVQQPELPVDTEYRRSHFVVDASQRLNETGLFVYPGQAVSIVYKEGNWQAGPSPTWPLVGPDGDQQVLSNPTFPVPDAPVASLIAGLDFAPPVLVGHGTSFIANTAGSLWLAANDDGYGDNVGSVVVDIQLGQRPLETAAPRFSAEPIAYSCGSDRQNQIFLSDLDSGRQVQLAGQPPNSMVPAFSPDGAKIAYRSDESGVWQLYVSDVDGSNRRQVTSGVHDNYEANWSPDGNRFAFVSDRTGSKQIYVMESDGSNQQQLTNNSSYNDDPSWSVTGQIAYESDQDGRYSIYRLSPEGGTPLLFIDAGNSSTTPAWSPDGQQIAFESRVGDLRHIWIASKDGSNLQRITSEGTRNQRPAWSPDGRWLAFHSNYQQSSDSQFDIWAIEIETGDLIRLSHRGDCNDPAWGSQPSQLPPIREDIEACRLSVGAAVTSGPNARLWNTPDVISGQALDTIPPETTLLVTSGPIWGQIRRDIDASDWWWKVERPSDGLTGWIWQARLQDCEGP